MDTLDSEALALLRRLTGRSDAEFHNGQLEAIRALAGDRQRVLVVQRTGWGKSAVYFIATQLLRDAGRGPTLLVSPLLALMRDQIKAASRMGIRAKTINSSNTDEWGEVGAAVVSGELDLLLISPERLANESFREKLLDHFGATAGLVVVDEAHCISDWGHDFRPDYRRIRRLLDLLPRTVPVLACTATANDRVVDDVVSQLGADLRVFRGALSREGLALHVITLDAPSARMAWLAQTIPQLTGSGIVYCLTKRDVEAVAQWLRTQGIVAEIYTGASDDRERIEQALLSNDVDVVVATSALGMGFDKPDLAYVIHFQAPGSVIGYYQQVGRAGRQLPSSLGVLLRGAEDADIQDWFISTAFPTAEESARVIAALEHHDGYMKLTELEAFVNVKPSRIELLMKNLEVDGVVVAKGKKYQRTPRPFTYDTARTEAVTALRRAEQQQMLDYGALNSGCRMAFLGAALDDRNSQPCGVCDLCAGPSLSRSFDPNLASEAAEFLRKRPVVITPRKQWPGGQRIQVELQNLEGRALSRWGDGGWSELVKQGKQVNGNFDQRLVEGMAKLIRSWKPDPEPTWIAWVPSLNHWSLVPDFARGLGAALRLPAVEAVLKTRPTQPQKNMENSAQQFTNIEGAFTVNELVRGGVVLLVDDIVDSRWTLTYVGSLLRQAGCSGVWPVALADSGQS